MDFQTYLNSIGLGNGRGEAYDDAVNAARVNYDQLMQSGAYGSNIGGIVPGITNPGVVMIDGQQWVRSGLSPEMITEARLSGMLPADAYRFDPAQGHLIRADVAQGLNAQAQQISQQDKQGGLVNGIQGFFDNGGGVFALGGAGMGAALGGAFPGVDAAGNAISAGNSGILSQFGVNNPFSGLGGNGTELIGADDATGGAVGGDGYNIPGGQAELDAFMNGLGAEMLNPSGSSGAFFPTDAAGWNALLKGVGAVGSVGSGALSGADDQYQNQDNESGSRSPENILKGLDAGGVGVGDFLSKLFTPSSLMGLLGAAGSIGGGIYGANAAEKAAQIQADSAAQSNALLRDIYNQNREDLKPWRDTGVNALTRLSKITEPGSQLSQLELDPGYQFRLGEGQKAIERSAAARGNLLSGATMKAVGRYGQDYASGEYGNAVNRLLAQSGLGQSATNTGVQAGQNFGNQAANNLTGAGNARASGYVGGANAITGGITNGLNTYLQNEFMNKLLARP